MLSCHEAWVAVKGGIWRFCGELQEQLHRDLPAEKGQALVGAAVGAMLESPCSQEGFLAHSDFNRRFPSFSCTFPVC